LVALGRRCPADAAPPAVATAPVGSPQPAAAPVVTPPAAPLSAPDSVVKPTTVAAAPATPAPPVDTAIKPVPPPPTKPAAPPPGAAVPDAYRVQIVAANSQEAADEMLDRARKAGFSGVIVKEGGYFKVRLGQYATRAEASAAAAKVKAKLGGSPFVVAP
jgi:cell division septation protein DedD